MTYVEGFVTPVPTANKDKYVAHAEKASGMIREMGATRFVETWGDDVPHGKLNDLHMAVDAKADETVLFSWFEYPDKATRDAANRKMQDGMGEGMDDMPFDGSRMIFSGFEEINRAGPGGEFGYLDGVVAPVETAKKAEYTAFCKKMADLFVEQGATQVVDAWGDDLIEGKQTDFKRAAHLKDGETAAYGWIEWPSKDVRDKAWETLMQDERFNKNEGAQLMDGKRMMFGGFRPIVAA